MQEKTQGWLSDAGLVYAALIWGSTFFIVKGALRATSPVTLVAYRFLIAAAIMAIILVYRKKSLVKNLHHGIILGIILAGLYLPQTIGLKYTSAANSGFITGLFIIFTPLFSYLLFKKIPSTKRSIAIAISISGLFLLTGGLRTMNIGDILTLAAAVTYALHILSTDKFVELSDPYVLTFQQFATVGILSLGAALLFRQPLITTSTGLWIILFLAIFPTALAFLIQTIAQQHTSPIKVALIFALEPVFAALFAWTVGGETMTMPALLGGALIVAAMAIAELPETTKQ